MHDASIMSELQRFTDRRHDGQSLLRRQPSGRHGLSKVDSVDKFHQQEIKVARSAKVVDGHDVWVGHLGENLAFPREAIGKVRIVRVLRGQNLQCDQAAERFLFCFIDRAHSAVADQFDDFELFEFGGDFVDGRRSPRCGRDAVRAGSQCGLLK